MYCTSSSNTEQLKRELATALRTIDKLQALDNLSQGQEDALRASEIYSRTYTEQLLDNALYTGVTFIEIPVTDYSICYELDHGRWEGFVTKVTQS
jgi:hypothetical protein